MKDHDGNFVEQLQTHGLNARVFELGLFAYFAENGFQIDQSHKAPDFVVSNGKIKVAVEAVTSQPQKEHQYENNIDNLKLISEEELDVKIAEELPIKIGGPLNDKLKKKYWKLPQCENLPFILVIQPFHEAASLTYIDGSIAPYLYGLLQTTTKDKYGETEVFQAKIDNHSYGKKSIPTNFFGLPESQHVSAVIYSNQLTVSKFMRMAYQMGDKSNLQITKSGFCYHPTPGEVMPLEFEFDMDDPDIPAETWGQGLTVFHNPNAVRCVFRAKVTTCSGPL